MRSTAILIGLILCFFGPWIVATTYFYYFQSLNGSQSEPILKTGFLVAPGTHISTHPLNNNWTLLCVAPTETTTQNRFLLWKEQSQLFPSFLKKNNLNIEILEAGTSGSINYASIQQSLPWNISEGGAAILIDPNGFVAIAFSYNESPKQAFFTVKKLVST